MSSERFQQAAELFEKARELEGEQRVALLNEACAQDAELRDEVESLLKRHDRRCGNNRLEAIQGVIRDRAEAMTAETVPGPTPRTIGRYEIKDVIASGGMGIVYRAVQDHPHRVVALKVMRQGAVSRQAIQRFRHEAEVLGRLKHPHIAQIHDAGTFDEGHGAQPFFAMELIEGLSLSRYTEVKKLGTRDRLGLFEKVCDAVQYAHHRGVIHRDLKPDNILVDEHGEPKVLDFGVARATDADIQVTTLRTDIGQLVGTIPYMSPEQVSGNPEQLDTRSDVYSLGVVLYEQLVGRLPYELADKTIPEAVRIIGEEDPQRLSTVDRTLRGDLDTIVAKALEKDKTRRYQSPGELAADVRHYLADEPIAARPASTLYQLQKFARRNKPLVVGVAAVFAVLISGIVGVSLSLAEAKREAEKSTLISGFFQEVLTSSNPLAWGDREVGVADVLIQAAKEIENRFASHPDVAAQLRLTIGETLHGLGRIPEAEVQLRLAYEQGQHVLGHEHPTTLRAGLYLADVALKRRLDRSLRPGQEVRTDDALPLSRQLLESSREVYGEKAWSTLEAVELYAYALIYSNNDQHHAEAESILTDAVAVAVSEYGDDDAITYRLNRALTLAFMYGDKFAEGEERGRWLVAWGRRKPDRQIWVAYGLIPLSYLVSYQGESAQGVLFAKEAYETTTELLGSDHPATQTAGTGLGFNLLWSGRFEDAEPVFAQSSRLSSRFALTRLRLLQGSMDPEDALPTIEEFVAETQPIQPQVWEVALTAQALCLVRLGRYEDAQQVMQRHPGKFMNAIAPNHYERRLYLNTLVEIYEGLDEPEKAAEYRALVRKAEQRDDAD